MTASGRKKPAETVRFGSIPAGQDLPVRWSHPRQMASQVRCNFPCKLAVGHE